MSNRYLSSVSVAGGRRSDRHSCASPAVLVLAAIAVVFFWVEPASAQWQRLPMPTGGTVHDILHDPTGAVFAGTGRGTYRSTDGGVSWEWVHASHPVEHLERAGSAILASSVGLFRSTDGGTTWTESFVHPDGFPVARGLAVDPADPQTVVLSAYYNLTSQYVFQSTDGGQTFADASGDLTGPVNAVAISSDGGTWFAAGEATTTTVYASTDSGATWNPGSPSGSDRVLVITPDPSDPLVLHVGTEGGGVYRSTDGGTTFSPASTGLPAGANVVDLRITQDGRYALAALDAGVFTSSDGMTWAPTGSLAPENALAVSSNPASVDDLLVGTASANQIPTGVFRSQDFGASWAASNAGMEATVDARDLAASPVDPDRLVLAAGPNLLASSDRGATWAVSALDSAFSVAGSGLAASRFFAMTFRSSSPSDFYRSPDGGITWTPSGSILTSDYLFSMSVSRVDPQVIWIGSGGPAAAVFKSSDEGAAWVPADAGLPAGAFEPKVAAGHADPMIAYVGDYFGVYRTADGGASWQATALVNDIQDLAVDPVDGTLYAVSIQQLWTSADEGASWADITGSLGSVKGVEVDAAGGIIYAEGSQSPTIHGSFDAGGTWVPIPNVPDLVAGFFHNVALTADPSVSGRLYYLSAVGRYAYGLSDPYTIDWVSDLAVTKTGALDVGSDGMASVGDLIHYTFTVENTGTMSLTGVGITDPLVQAIDCSPQTNGAIALDPGQIVTCTGEYAITLADLDAGSVPNTAVADAVDAGARPVSAQASWTEPLGATADLQLAKTVDPQTVHFQEAATFTLVVDNLGPATAIATEVTDDLPAGLTWNSDDCGAGPPVGGQLLWHVGDLAPAATATCNVVLVADGTVAGDLTNSASAVSATTDPNPANGAAAATVTVTQVPQIPVLSRTGIALLIILIGGAGVILRRA